MTDDDKSKKPGRGLQTEINPLLLSSNPILIKTRNRNENPYLSQEGKGKRGQQEGRRLQFYQKGEITAKIRKQRELEREELLKREQELKENQLEEARIEHERQFKIVSGELPDLNKGEDKFIPRVEDIPLVEWWDKPYLDDHEHLHEKYVAAEKESDDDDDDDELPSIRYIQHPVPVKIDTTHLVSKVYLTKREQKKVRRNRRKLEREEKETKIKLGIEPKPLPKVKLSNMMSVYENSANITDPTAWEQQVRTEVEQRKLQHEQTNKQRHQEAVERRKQKPSTKKLESYSRVYYFSSLRSPKIRYKLNMNSKQLKLRGTCLRVGDTGPGVIVVIGNEKACKFYDKLITRRLQWDKDFSQNDDTGNSITIDMSGTYAEKLWEGILENTTFRGWFMKVCQTTEELRHTLKAHNAEHVYDLFASTNKNSTS